MSQRVLITGGTGFVGSHVVEAYLKSGWVVRALVRDTKRLKWLAGLDIELAEGSLSDEGALRRATADCSVVIHCAGLTKALRLADYLRVNADATKTLISCANGNSVHRFIFCSSQAAAGVSRDGAASTENDPPAPITDYGRSKLAGEEAVKSDAGTMEWIILRPPAVIGPRDEQFVPLFRLITKYGRYPQLGDPLNSYSYIYVQDLAQAFLQAGEAQAGVNALYFAAHPEPISWREAGNILGRVIHRNVKPLRIPDFLARTIGSAVDMFSQVSGKPGLLSSDKVKEMTTKGWICSPERIKSVWGFECRRTAQETLSETLEFYRQEKWL